MRQTRDNPTSNFNITTDTYAVTATGASGTVTSSDDVSVLERGQSILFGIDGGSAEGFTDGQEYFVIPVDTNNFRIANSKEDAMDGTYVSGASGDAGAGTVYPSYKVGGVLVTNTAGNVYIRGINNKTRGFSSFSLQTTSVDGSVIPFMIGEFSTSGMTAGGFVSWNQ